MSGFLSTTIIFLTISHHQRLVIWPSKIKLSSHSNPTFPTLIHTHYYLPEATSCRCKDKFVIGGDGQLGPTFPGNSKSLAIWCILRCLALIRPLVNLCLAAIHRIWSSKVNVAESSGAVLEAGTWAGEAPEAAYELPGLWTVTCKHLKIIGK